MASEDEDDTPKVPSDAYVGMLGIASAALIVATVLLFLDQGTFPDAAPQAPTIAAADTGLVVPGPAGAK